MSSGNSHDPLQAYIDELLADSLLGDNLLNDASGVSNRVDDEAALKLAAGSNIASLPNTPRPARTVPVRPYAEPIRTLNLRMPLPPIAPAAALVVESAPVTVSAPVVETELRVEAKPLQTEPKPSVVSPQPVATPLEPIAPHVEAEPIAETHTTTASVSDLATMAPPAPWWSNGRPQWAQRPFECLLFKAGGLELAAPLVELGSIYPLESDGLTEIFGQTQWFMGLLPVKEYNVRTMDTALVVMPERYNAAMRDNYRYVVSLFGSDWGLAVDAVLGTVLLDPERIRWRGERGKRPWLAGTLIDQMCALFDIAQVAWLFHNQDRKRVSL